MNHGHEQWWVSELNLRPEVLGECSLPPRLGIYDTTLRDGEQTIGVSFDAAEKVEIAHLLAEVGVDRLEAGMPIVSASDFEAVKRIVAEVKGPEIWGFCRCRQADIDACVDAGLKAVICEIPTSPYKLKAYGFSIEGVLENLVKNLQYARSRGLYTAFFVVDATRTSLDVLERAYKAAVHEGQASEVVIADTLGVATPEAIFYLTKQVAGWVDVPVMVHCHNDFGMATACTMAALRAGATHVQVTVNGLGEKTGNADLAEVVLAAVGLYNLPTGINTRLLRPLAARLESITGIELSPLKPVVGRTVFQRESGVAVAQLATYPPAVEGFSPEVVGAGREVLLSKKSGKGSVEYALSRLGLDASDEEVESMLSKVKALGVEKKGPLSDQEFESIAAAVLQPK